MFQNNLRYLKTFKVIFQHFSKDLFFFPVLVKFKITKLRLLSSTFYCIFLTSHKVEK